MKARQNQVRLLRVLHTVGQQNWSISNCHCFRYALDDKTSDYSSDATPAVAPEKQLLFDYAFERLFGVIYLFIDVVVVFILFLFQLDRKASIQL